MIGLPGRVLHRREALWTPDSGVLSAAARPPRRGRRLSTALAFPILAGDESSASSSSSPIASSEPDAGLLALVPQIGTELGRVANDGKPTSGSSTRRRTTLSRDCRTGP